MLRSVRGLQDSSICALDGEIGSVDEFLFDDQQWTIRYLVVDTGGWLLGRRVLISPVALGNSDWERQLLHVNLTREQIERSPGVETDRPVSRQWEASHFHYYGWPAYWGGAGLWGWGWYPGALAAAQVSGPETWREEVAQRVQEEADEHLRSTREVTGYTIHAMDGELGHVEDFILDEETWAIRYVSVDTQKWWPGKKVLLSPEWILDVNWPEKSVAVDLTREQIRNAPEWDPSVPISRGYEERLLDHYGRPRSWEREETARLAA